MTALCGHDHVVFHDRITKFQGTLAATTSTNKHLTLQQRNLTDGICHDNAS